MKIRDRIVDFRRVKASELIPHPSNWRTHPPEQEHAMRGVLDEIGIADAVLARETPDGLQLIDGHLRRDLDEETTWPVLVLDVDEAEANKILATHDPLAAMAGTDVELLSSLLDEIETSNEALQEMLDGMADDAGLIEPPEIEEDEPPEPPADPVTKTGDLWILGDHRVLCGDATNAEDVARLMDGNQLDLAFTSPPYNVGGNTMGGHLKSSDVHSKYQDTDDQLCDDEYKALLTKSLGHLLGSCKYAVVNLQMLAANKRIIVEWLYEHRQHLADVAIWNKTHGAPAMGDNVLNAAFEFMFVFAAEVNPSRRIATASFRGSVQNVYSAKRGEQNEFADVHAATFPVHLPAWVIRTFSSTGDVLDPFLGSGTTLIAAEQLNRRCFGLEISPAYCDVVVERWQNLTGKKATR